MSLPALSGTGSEPLERLDRELVAQYPNQRDMAAAERFPIRFDAWYRVLSTALFIAPSASYVEVSGDEVLVRMAWVFRARFARSTIEGAAAKPGNPISRGVHGFGGRWLVNGSGKGLVIVKLRPPQSGYVLGVPVQLRELVVSVEDPRALLDALLAHER